MAEFGLSNPWSLKGKLHLSVYRKNQPQNKLFFMKKYRITLYQLSAILNNNDVLRALKVD